MIWTFTFFLLRLVYAHLFVSIYIPSNKFEKKQGAT